MTESCVKKALRFSNDQEQRNIAASLEEIPINLREKKMYKMIPGEIAYGRQIQT